MVGGVLPALPPELPVLLVVPVHGVLLVAFPSAGREPDSFPVPVKVVDFPALGKPPAGFVQRPHGKQDMGVWVARPLVVNGKISNHAFGDELLPAIVPY